MIKINVTTDEIVELFNLAGDKVKDISLEENAGGLRVSKPGEFDVELGSIALNDVKVRIKGVGVAVDHVTLRDGAVDIEGGVE